MADFIPFSILADVVLALHLALVVFVVGGLMLVLIGNLLRWGWVNALAFRLAHLVVIAVVAAESWLGIVCPLTSLEMWLRVRAGAARYSGGFIEYWLQRLLYYDAPPWVFLLAYTAFAVAVALTWWYFPPAGMGGRNRQSLAAKR